jgi:hypothetical protein
MSQTVAENLHARDFATSTGEELAPGHAFL